MAEQGNVPSGDARGASSVRVACALALVVVTSRVRRHLDLLAGEAGLTPPQARVLVTLSEPMPMQEVARLNACEPSHVTGVAEQLEAAGLVLREPDPADRRVRRLSPTRAGEQLRGRLLEGLGQGDSVLGGLDDARVADLLRLLTR